MQSLLPVIIPGIATIPTTDIVFKLDVIAAFIDALMIGKTASILFAPKANRISGSCCFSETSDNNLEFTRVDMNVTMKKSTIIIYTSSSIIYLSTAKEGPATALPIIIPVVGI